jgi:hypothetical protein
MSEWYDGDVEYPDPDDDAYDEKMGLCADDEDNDYYYDDDDDDDDE